LSRYKNINNIADYVKQEKLEDNIIAGDISNLNAIAKTYVYSNFNKKLGKKLSIIKKNH